MSVSFLNELTVLQRKEAGLIQYLHLSLLQMRAPSAEPDTHQVRKPDGGEELMIY